MLVHEPLVSVCIPAYNCERYIGETLHCLTTQTHQNLELIVVNDGSTDNTLAVAQKFHDKRIQIIESANGGAAKARNTAFQHAKGDYVIFFDADDHIDAEFIARQVACINGKKDIVVLSAWGRFYNDDLSTFKLDKTPSGQMTFKEWINFYWYNCNPMTNPGRTIIPYTLAKKAGPWNESLSLTDDMEFFTRIFLQSKAIVFNTEAIFYYRSGVMGLSGKKGDAANESFYRSVDLSINHVLSHFKNEPGILKSCANTLQSFIYTTYPSQKNLLLLASNQIKKLARPDLKFQSSGYTRILTGLIGWRIAKRVKLFLSGRP
jgi:glycosyltransferase involved in cell wall biosynthesis